MRLGSLARASARATVQDVYEDLHGQIVRGALRPGDPMSETRVAE